MTRKQDTVLDALLAALDEAAAHNPDDVVRPVAVLWTDGERR